MFSVQFVGMVRVVRVRYPQGVCGTSSVSGWCFPRAVVSLCVKLVQRSTVLLYFVIAVSKL